MTKKIMFNDKYELTKRVLNGQKTMTRRFVKEDIPLGNLEEAVKHLPYKIGDIVAIAQTYKDIYTEKITDFTKHKYRIPRAEVPEKFKKLYENTAGWNNKMFVKSELMRHHIKITDIKIERLQDISKEDCLCEGILERYDCYRYVRVFKIFTGGNVFDTARQAFATLIDKVGKKGDWKKNPLVAVYTFELVD